MSKIAPVEQEWRRQVSFDFGKGGLQPPDGFKELSIDDEVTVLVTGKVKDLRQSEDTSGFSLRMEKIQLKTGGKSRSMTDILEGKKKSRK